VSSKIYIGTGVLSAIAASLCCISPVVALLAGTTSAVSTFAWLAPARPYFIGLTIGVLSLAWFMKLRKPVVADDCGCEPAKEPFLQSKKFLFIITLFALLMLSFPLVSKSVLNNAGGMVNNGTHANSNRAEFTISGMTCDDCELHVSYAVTKLKGIHSVKVSYDSAMAVVQFDSVQIGISEIKNAINSTGYKVVNTIQKSK
jgi:mercuric ion transport protein